MADIKLDLSGTTRQLEQLTRFVDQFRGTMASSMAELSRAAQEFGQIYQRTESVLGGTSGAPSMPPVSFQTPSGQLAGSIHLASLRKQKVDFDELISANQGDCPLLPRQRSVGLMPTTQGLRWLPSRGADHRAPQISQ